MRFFKKVIKIEVGIKTGAKTKSKIEIDFKAKTKLEIQAKFILLVSIK